MSESGWFERGARLEPVNKTYAIEEGVQARVKDPLWMLGRQWQTDEFVAINGGHPVQVEATYHCRTIDKMSLRGASPVSFNVSTPLEKLVEEETPEGIAHGWDSKHLEYNFSIENGDAKLAASEYYGEQIDWFSIDVEGTPNLAAETASLQKITVQPQPVRYNGMPHPRWFTFEDGLVSLADIGRPYLNFLTMILVEFALIYSQDWYLFPIKHKVGDLRAMKDINIIDTFGFVTSGEPALDQSEDWSGFELFSLSQTGESAISDPRLFFMPNNLWTALESEPIEHVDLFRDELANLVWAVEERVVGTYGLPCNRHLVDAKESENLVLKPTHYWDNEAKRLMEAPDSFPEGEPGGKFIGPIAIYDKQQLPPRHWVPFIQQLRNGEVILRRARTHGDKANPQYLGQFLRESKVIYEEEIPRAGISLSRIYQLARDSNGVQVTWLGRKKRPARPRRSSNLSFDRMIEP